MVEIGAKSQSYNQKRALWSGILLGRASSRALDAWSLGALITKLGAERPARCLFERDRVQRLVCVSPSRTLHISLCLCWVSFKAISVLHIFFFISIAFWSRFSARWCSFGPYNFSVKTWALCAAKLFPFHEALMFGNALGCRPLPTW